MSCKKQLHAEGKPYPRTCDECGIIGPCRYVFPTKNPQAAMSDQRITVEQVRQQAYSLGLSMVQANREWATVDERDEALEERRMLNEMLEQFAAQQRADAMRELQREIAETAKSAAGWMNACVESNTKLHDLCNELAAANECARINAENSHYWHGEAIAAKAQLAEAEKDAQRYRWLRDPESSVGSVMDKAVGYTPYDAGTQTGGYTDYEYRAGAELDAAIDAAIAIQSARDATACPHLRRTTHKGIVDRGVERDRCVDFSCPK